MHLVNPTARESNRLNKMIRWLKPLAVLLLVSVTLGLSGCGQPDGSRGLISGDPWRQAYEQGTNPQRQELISLGIKDVTYEVEVAGGEYGLMLGLMYRKELGPDKGMWFEFPEEDFRNFWMRNTRVPLSIAYVDSRGEISNIEDMIPFDESRVLSKRKVKYALEMKRGWFQEKGIKAGDVVRIGTKKANPEYSPE